MSTEDLRISISRIDEERFRIKIAKAEGLTIENIPDALKFCKNNMVRMLITRCPTHDLSVVQEIEHGGFLLMDTLIYYSCNLRKNPLPEYTSEIQIRPFKLGEENIVKSIASEAFNGYLGHYHADAGLEKVKCDEVYTDWAYKSCHSKEVADEVFIAEMKGKVIGFGTVRASSADEGQYILAGVLRPYQGLGIYRMILINCMRWCVERGIGSIITATQITNLSVQKVWIRLGFEPVCSYYTFHKWFDLSQKASPKRP